MGDLGIMEQPEREKGGGYECRKELIILSFEGMWKDNMSLLC